MKKTYIFKVVLILSLLLNLVLGFIAIDRTIRVNELVGGGNADELTDSDRPSYPSRD